MDTNELFPLESEKICGDGYLRNWCDICYHMYPQRQINFVKENFEESLLVKVDKGGYSEYF